MIRLAIFDLDGTLLNTIDDLAAAGNYVLKLHGFPTHTADEFKYFVGNGVYLMIERMTPPAHRDDTELNATMKHEFDVYYEAHRLDLTAPYDGVDDMLDKLLQRDIACAVLSNKPDAFTKALITQFFGERFIKVQGQCEGRPIKPDSILTKDILKETGFTCAETIYIGDSGVDMQTAKNGGLFAVGALWGFRTKEELLENGADALAESPKSVLRYI